MSIKPIYQSLNPEDSFAPLIEQFTTYLKARCHKNTTLSRYLASARHFLCWLTQQPFGSREINPRWVREFIEAHLPVCHCSSPAPRSLKTIRAALNQLLLMQGHDRLHAPDKPASTEIEASLRQFATYLRDVCGLAPTTCRVRCRYVRGFLDDLFGDQPLAFKRINAKCLICFITGQSRHYQPTTLGALACALRSYLRFLQFTGVIPATLAIAIPTPPNWRLAALPPSLDEDELSRFWSAFDRSTAIGKRDYAMARCLADLALRCHEVAGLRLDAIDWRAGTLRLEQTKSHRVELLPLPQTTAQALIDYFRQGRPSTSSRAVFVYHRAPRGEGVRKTTVRGSIRRAFGRAGLAWSGTHILRHTAATRMLQGGTSLKAITDVLRHRSIDTTLIYTKVDLLQLSRVAMPWPGQPS
jgi:integrase